MVGHAPGAAGREEAESLVQTVADLAGRQVGDARCRQLDRQREAVDAATDLSDGRRVRFGHLEADARGPSTLEEELAGI